MFSEPRKKAILVAVGFAATSVFDLYAISSPDYTIISHTGEKGISFCVKTDSIEFPVLKLECGKTKEIGSRNDVKVDYMMVTGKKKHCSNSFRSGIIS